MNEIQAALAALEVKGDFYSERTVDGEYLQIKVNKIGRLAYPLTKEAVQSLIALAEPAKYGLREQTILDENVRKVWEIKPSKFDILKTGWKKAFEPLLKQIKDDLGLPGETRIMADLHNMLVYESGCFFKTHQDSEKANDMVATMVVVLPTEHSGGELIVEHNGRQYVFDSAKEKVMVQAFSFYADCRHEVKPLESGYRVVLTFNLILENYKGQVSSLIEPDFNKRVNTALKHYFSSRSWLPSWEQNNKDPMKFVYLLDHEYTESGLSWQHLKNRDRVRADALLNAADENDLEAYLTLVDSHETWDCYEESYSYRSRKRRYYDDDSDEENYVLNDLIERETTVEYWLDRKGNHKNFNACYVRSHFVHATVSGEKFTPYNSEYEGFMGNYGNTLDRWYKRAAIVMWQKKDAEKILFQIDPLSYISKLYQSMRDGVAIAEIKADLYPKIDELQEVWSAFVKQVNTREQYAEMFDFVIYIEDPKRAQEILVNFSYKLIAPEFAKYWHNLSTSYGTNWVVELFARFIESARLSQGLPEFSKLMGVFHEQALDTVVLRFLFSTQLAQAVSGFKYDLSTPRRRRETLQKRHQCVEEFAVIALQIEDTVLSQKVMDLVLSNQLSLDPVKLIELVDQYTKLKFALRDAYGVDRLVHYVLLALETEKDLGVREENNWAIPFDGAKHCAFCKELAVFLLDEVTQEKIWPIAKDKREHISGIIHEIDAPVSVKTLAQGSPHKLIITKDNDMHAKANKRYKQVCGALAQLRLDFNVSEGAL